MLSDTIAQALEYPWQPVIEPQPDGTWRTAIAEIPDFEVFFASQQEANLGWKLALRSHLRGYLACGKVIPVPVSFSQASPGSPSTEGEYGHSAAFTLQQMGNLLVVQPS